MPKLIIDVQCGAKECGECQDLDIICGPALCRPLREFPGRGRGGRRLRLPACLAAEKQLADLVEAARKARRYLGDHDREADEELYAALAPFEEARHE